MWFGKKERQRGSVDLFIFAMHSGHPDLSIKVKLKVTSRL
jgi:hypothetical protein